MNHIAQPAKPSLPQWCTEFLAEFWIALQKFAMYPENHPALAPAVDSLADRVTQLLHDREQLAVEIGVTQVVVDGLASEPDHDAFRRLAECIYRHQVGGVSFRRGIGPSEIADALGSLAQDPVRHGAIGTRPAPQRPGWPRLRMYPLAVDGTTVADDDPMNVDLASTANGDGLWVQLTRTALAGGTAGALYDGMLAEPSLIAHAIETRPEEGSYDQAVVDSLAQIADELRLGTGPEVHALRHRTAKLVRALQPATLRRLTGRPENPSTRTLLRGAVQGMAIDAALAFASAAAEERGHPIPQELLRVLTKLSTFAAHGEPQVRPQADTSLREHLAGLLGELQLIDAAPASVDVSSLSGAAGDVPDTPARIALTPPDPLRVVQMGLEGGWHRALIQRAIDRAVTDGPTAALPRLANELAKAGFDSVVLRDHLLRPDVLKALLAEPDACADGLDRLQPFLSSDHYSAMLDVLAATESRVVRRRLLDRLAVAPVDLRAHILARLADPRWFVQRNMLALLERTGQVPDGFDFVRWTASGDVRVRRQAIRLWLAQPDEREQAVRAALGDGHPRLALSALSAVRDDCPGSLADAVGHIALDAAADPELRILAARALGRCRDPRALETLLVLTDGGCTLFGRTKLAPRSPVTLAAVRGLADGWRSDARAEARLRLADAAVDADIRHAIEVNHR